MAKSADACKDVGGGIAGYRQKHMPSPCNTHGTLLQQLAAFAKVDAIGH